MIDACAACACRRKADYLVKLIRMQDCVLRGTVLSQKCWSWLCRVGCSSTCKFALHEDMVADWLLPRHQAKKPTRTLGQEDQSP